MRLLVLTANSNALERVRQELRATSRTWELVSATSLQEALQKLEAESFQAVLLGLDLPENHADLVAKLFADAPTVPIVAFTDAGNIPKDLPPNCLIFRTGAKPSAAETLEQLIGTAECLQTLQAQLDGSERQLKMLTEQVPAMLWTTDENLIFTTMRGRELAILDLDPKEIVGKSVNDLFAGRSSAHVAGELHGRALSGESTSMELHWHQRYYHAHVEPLRNASRDIVGTIGVALDVTDEQKLRRDVHAAHQVQEHLLPSRAPDLKGFEIAGKCFPADDCSGDFFDYMPLRGKRLAIILADVSGHGFGPAILAAAIRSYLRMAAILGNQVHEMLALANRLLIFDGDLTPFASVFAASIDPAAKTMRYASAGHPAYLLHFDGRRTRLESLAVPIGVRDDESFTLSQRLQLQPGDIVLLFSDGVFEVQSPAGEQFGIQRTLDVVHQNQFEDASVIVDRLHAAAVAFAGDAPIDDDQTIVVVKVVPTESTRETWTAP